MGRGCHVLWVALIQRYRLSGNALKMTLRRFPTLADVARVAGLSRATVSRYLNKPAGRATGGGETASRAPSTNSDTFRTARPGHWHRAVRTWIGALFPSLDSILFGSFIGPLQASLQRRNYTLVVSSSDYLADMEYEQLARAG